MENNTPKLATNNDQNHAFISQLIKLHTRELNRFPFALSLANAASDEHPLVYVNDHFLHLAGYREREVVGFNCRFLQGPKSNPDTIARLRAGIHGTDYFQEDLINYTKGGTPFWNRILIKKVQSQKHSLFIASQRDVSLLIQREQLATYESRRQFLSPDYQLRLSESEAVRLETFKTYVSFLQNYMQFTEARGRY